MLDVESPALADPREPNLLSSWRHIHPRASALAVWVDCHYPEKTGFDAHTQSSQLTTSIEDLHDCVYPCWAVTNIGKRLAVANYDTFNVRSLAIKQLVTRARPQVLQQHLNFKMQVAHGKPLTHLGPS